jgi:hypothetical protein
MWDVCKYSSKKIFPQLQVFRHCWVEFAWRSVQVCVLRLHCPRTRTIPSPDLHSGQTWLRHGSWTRASIHTYACKGHRWKVASYWVHVWGRVSAGSPRSRSRHDWHAGRTRNSRTHASALIPPPPRLHASPKLSLIQITPISLDRSIHACLHVQISSYPPSDLSIDSARSNLIISLVLDDGQATRTYHQHVRHISPQTTHKDDPACQLL